MREQSCFCLIGERLYSFTEDNAYDKQGRTHAHIPPTHTYTYYIHALSSCFISSYYILLSGLLCLFFRHCSRYLFVSDKRKTALFKIKRGKSPRRRQKQRTVVTPNTARGTLLRDARRDMVVVCISLNTKHIFGQCPRARPVVAVEYNQRRYGVSSIT